MENHHLGNMLMKKGNSYWNKKLGVKDSQEKNKGPEQGRLIPILYYIMTDMRCTNYCKYDYLDESGDTQFVYEDFLAVSCFSMYQVVLLSQ